MASWKEVNSANKPRSLQTLLQARYIQTTEKNGRVFNVTLTKSGQHMAQQISLENLTVPKPKKWDGMWRLVMADIPETKKRIRNAIRHHLRRIGFIELQKSVWIFPYPCEDEVRTIIDFHFANRYVRLALVDTLDNDTALQKHFKLLPE